MSTNFKQTKIYDHYLLVIKWNYQFGALVNDKPADNLDVATIKYRYAIIEEEVKELGKAINEKNLIEIWDGICDILVTVYGGLSAFGYPLDLSKNSKLYNSVLADNYPLVSKNLLEDNKIVEELKKNFKSIMFFLQQLKKYCDEKKLKSAAKMLNIIVRLTLQVAYIAKLDPNKGMQIVSDSNFDKAAKTEKEAKETVKAYANGTMKKIYSKASYKKLNDEKEKKFVIFDIESKKILKRLGWKEPDFSSLFQN